jgi:hypothetical protein
MYEKLKEIFAGIRKVALYGLPVAGVFELFKWFFNVYIPSRAQQVLDWLFGLIPQENLNISGVGLDWARINQWIPVTEAVQYGAKFLVVAGGIVFLKWLGKLAPWSVGK